MFLFELSRKLMGQSVGKKEKRKEEAKLGSNKIALKDPGRVAG
jgi:hypothetical protein